MQSYANLKTANIHYSSVFKNQQAAMMPIGTYFISTMIQAQKDGECDFNWGIATLPHSEGIEAGYTVGATTPLAISAYTDVPDLAWDFVKFATSEEASDLLAGVGTFPAVLTDGALDTIAGIDGFPQDETSKEVLKYCKLHIRQTTGSDISKQSVYHSMKLTK